MHKAVQEGVGGGKPYTGTDYIFQKGLIYLLSQIKKKKKSQRYRLQTPSAKLINTTSQAASGSVKTFKTFYV